MAIEILKWAGAINLVLFIRVLLMAPAAIRASTEAESLNAQANLIRARIAEELHARDRPPEGPPAGK